jgi:hypothetical protein
MGVFVWTHATESSPITLPFIVFCSYETVSVCVAQAGLELEGWDCRCASLCHARFYIFLILKLFFNKVKKREKENSFCDQCPKVICREVKGRQL